MSSSEIKKGDIIQILAGDYAIRFLYRNFDQGGTDMNSERHIIITKEMAARPVFFLNKDEHHPDQSCWALVGTRKVEVPWEAIELIDHNDGRRHLHVEQGTYLD